MAEMFFSNLLHCVPKKFPPCQQDTTILMCARNEEGTIGKSIEKIIHQNYKGNIRLLVIDNGSTDQTRQEVLKWCKPYCHRQVEYLYCRKKGKANALNLGLRYVCTDYFLTVDVDTLLESNAVAAIMAHITAAQHGCVAGNLFVASGCKSIWGKMQFYDYLLSIAAVKRFQGSYNSTLVAQGAFSAYNTCAVKEVGGWQDVFGEDIVLTYQLLALGYTSGYEPYAAAKTTVPDKFFGFYQQRRRWAVGMLERLSQVKPWKQKNFFPRWFTTLNILVIYLDLAYLFGFIPAVILALYGYPYFVGLLTVFALFIGVIFFASTYIYQKRLGVPFQNTLLGFVCFLLFFQLFQSLAAIHGYITYVKLKFKFDWK